MSTQSAIASPASSIAVPAVPKFQIGRMLHAIGAYLRACRDAHAAAAVYEQLSRLSNDELARRGLSREDLRQHVVARLSSGL